MATKQRDIFRERVLHEEPPPASVFDSPARALLHKPSRIAFDNSHDAGEEAGILPEVARRARRG
jgi:hypothetical protein